MVRHVGLESVIKSLSWLTLSSALLASRAGTNTTLLFTLYEAVIVCYVVKTASTSENLLIPNCKERLWINHNHTIWLYIDEW